MKTRWQALLALCAFALPLHGQDADRDAILKSAKDYAEAFNKADAKAIAAMWTENGECREADGNKHVGKAAIEKAHADLFKASPGAKIELLVKSVRFPAKDLAIEEGLVRSTRSDKEMPASATYVAIHARENGVWKLALSSESESSVEHLEDLDWLLGSWTTKAKDAEIKISFAKDAKKPVILGSVSWTPTGKEALSSTIRIAFDPETEKLRSWGFEDDGAHSQGLWTNDGKSWLVSVRGVTAGGTPFSETIVLQKLNADTITWHCTDRVLDGKSLPDTTPMKLTRTK